MAVNSVSIIDALTPEDVSACLLVRRKVFIERQNVPEHEDLDGLDDSSQHFLLCFNGKPAGTARVRVSGSKAKIQRVAVLPEHQGLGLGKVLMAHILKTLANL
jgi:predicted GNAT family N-acyltransferase